MKLSVIMPVYNEESTVLEAIKRVEAAVIPGVEKELIIVDDGSKDKTRDILSRVKHHKIIFHEKNQGMGAAVRTGLLHASGHFVIKQDADLEYDPSNYVDLIKLMQEENLHAVYGSRFSKEKHKEISLHYFGNKLLTVCTNLIYGSNLTDMETCYKLVRLDVIKSLDLKATRFDLEPEVTAKLLKKGYNVGEVPINYSARKFKVGKKITWKDGVKALYYLLKYRFSD